MSRDRYVLEYLERPGRTMDDRDLAMLTTELREVAATCFDEVPYYQALTGERSELEHCVLVLARRADGSVAGFCSGILLQVDGLEHVLHMGLSCVHANDRRSGLTRRLNDTMGRTYLMKHCFPFKSMWFTSCACVLSSLGNVALYFDNCFPSPFWSGEPSELHRRIAQTVDRNYRRQVYIEPTATFDTRDFVFRGSVKDTMFEKTAEDLRFQHRISELNHWYRGLIRFENGDEVLQVARASAWTGLKSLLGVAKFREWQLKRRQDLFPIHTAES